MIPATTLIETIQAASDYDTHTDDDADTIRTHILTPDACRLPEMDAIDAEAAQVAAMDHGTVLARLSQTYWQADQQRRNAMADLRFGICEAAGSMSEAEIARVTGLNRMTVRKAVGK